MKQAPPSFFHEGKKFALPKYANFLPRFDKFFGAPMLGALLVSLKDGHILIANHQERGFFCYGRLDGNPGSGGSGCSLFARNGQRTGKADDVTEEWAVLIALNGNGFWIGATVGFASRKFIKALSGSLLGQQNNLSRGFGIFGSIVVFEVQVQNFLEIAQSVTAVALKFRPGLAGDDDAIVPVSSQGWKVVSFACLINSLLVKITVLDERMPLQKRAQILNRVVECWLSTNSFFVDTMEVDVEAIERALRVNVEINRVDRAGICDKGQAYLAYAGRVRVCCLDINGNKPESVIEYFMVLWGRFWLRLCLAKQFLENSHRKWTSNRRLQIRVILPLVEFFLKTPGSEFT